MRIILAQLTFVVKSNAKIYVKELAKYQVLLKIIVTYLCLLRYSRQPKAVLRAPNTSWAPNRH